MHETVNSKRGQDGIKMAKIDHRRREKRLKNPGTKGEAGMSAGTNYKPHRKGSLPSKGDKNRRGVCKGKKMPSAHTGA